jgi:glycine cleavage system H lipoate-binding protein
MTGFRPTDRSTAEDSKAQGQLRSQTEQERELQSIACSLDSGKEDQPCVWMQTGIVRRKSCRYAYRCNDCQFEAAMRRTAATNTKLREQGHASKGKGRGILGWEEKMKTLPLSKRPCIHFLKNQIRFKSCTNEYRCGNCEFDQYFHDEYKVHAVVMPVDLLEVEGFKMPQGYYLHQGHAWAKIEEGSCVRVGVDDFALRLLGPFDSIEAPLMGKAVREGEPHVVLKRGTDQARLLCPVSGVITAVNAKVKSSGKLANQMPYSEGWVMTIHPENLRRDLKNLMIAQEATEFLSHEADQLHRLIEEVDGPSATDGGQLGYDLYGMMPWLGWERLAKTFLRA